MVISHVALDGEYREHALQRIHTHADLRSLVGCQLPLGHAADATEVSEELLHQGDKTNARRPRYYTAIAARQSALHRALDSASSMEEEVVYLLTSAPDPTPIGTLSDFPILRNSMNGYPMTAHGATPSRLQASASQPNRPAFFFFFFIVSRPVISNHRFPLVTPSLSRSFVKTESRYTVSKNEFVMRRPSSCYVLATNYTAVGTVRQRQHFSLTCLSPRL